MKKLLLMTCALLALCTSLASAQINFSWNNCLGVGTHNSNKAYACDESLAGVPQRLVISFIPPAAMPQYVGMQGEIVVQTIDPTLPDFWRAGIGECREGTFNFPAPLTGVGNTTCVNPYTAATGGGYLWTSGAGNGGTPNPKQARIQVAVADANERNVPAGRHTIAGAGTLDLTMDLGNGACAGCEVPACLVVTQLDVAQTAGAPNGDFTLTTAATRQYVTWQGGAIGGLGCPGETPTRKATWGSVKSLYR